MSVDTFFKIRLTYSIQTRKSQLSRFIEEDLSVKSTFILNTVYHEEHYSHPEPEEIRKLNNVEL